MGHVHWIIIGATWLVAAFGSGALLAWLYRRWYRGLSFHKLWAFWTVMVSVIAAAVFALGLP